MERLLNNPKPSVALVVGTFAAVPYVHLHLETWKRYYSHIPLLVHDDFSPHRGQLKRLCDEYNVHFESTSSRNPHYVGDMAAFVAGFNFCKSNHIDLTVKLSRRFLPLYNWVDNLQRLAYTLQYATYSSRCIGYGFGFRTECIAMHTESWFRYGAVSEIENRVQKKESVFVEAFIHNLARDIHKNNCPYNKAFEKFSGRPSEVSAYGDWWIGGISRTIKDPEVLWHNRNSPADYAQVAQDFGLTQYTRRDFENPNSGFS